MAVVGKRQYSFSLKQWLCQQQLFCWSVQATIHQPSVRPLVVAYVVRCYWLEIGGTSSTK